MRALSAPVHPAATFAVECSGRSEDVVIRRVGPLSCAKVAGLLYLILGFIFGAFMSLFAVGGLLARQTESSLAGMLFGAGAIVILPICYAVFGFVMTLIMASLFNLVVGITGGIEVDAS
jgi:predicted phage tail protein